MSKKLTQREALQMVAENWQDSYRPGSKVWSIVFNKLKRQSKREFELTRIGLERYFAACQKLGIPIESAVLLEILEDANRGLTVTEIVNNDNLIFQGRV